MAERNEEKSEGKLSDALRISEFDARASWKLVRLINEPDELC